MIQNPQIARDMAELPEWGEYLQHLLPVAILEPADVSEAMIYLCGESGRYISGVALPLDAGWLVK